LSTAPDTSCAAVASDDLTSGLVLALAGTLAALLLLAWRINRSERARGLLIWLADRSLLRPWRRYRERRRLRALSGTFPEHWVALLRRNVRVYWLLTPTEQERLHNLIRRFLLDRQWEGCRGQPIDDEVRLTIAGQACLLLLGRPDDDFDNVPSILVYPNGFQTERHALLEERLHALGQAVYRGPVILAWDDVVAGGRDPTGGHNVVFHEFAHQLDFAGDAATTNDEEVARRSERQVVLSAEYETLIEDTRRGRTTLLDPYGATSPMEFFAVATECFFTRPIEMRQWHPQLYQVLHEFYGQDMGRRFETHTI
jgi:Mlc titration factor MtfA (ptsG expression regulator)